MIDYCGFFSAPIVPIVEENQHNVEGPKSSSPIAPVIADNKSPSSIVPVVSKSSSFSSPFDTYSEGYRWPSLYQEICDMVDMTILIYLFAELRELHRAGKIEDPDGKIMICPTTTEIISEVIGKGAEQITNRQDRKDKERAEVYKGVLEATRERKILPPRDAILDLVEEADRDEMNFYSLPRTTHVKPVDIVFIDDEFSLEELVYWIGLDHASKRVIICFRGSVTKRDWATNFERYMKEVPNPLKNHRSQKPTIKIHNGFHEYLFRPSSRGAKGPNGEDLCEYQEILQEHVLPELKKHPGYKLYVTGHSLGAALATIFAFEVAAQPDSMIPKPVTCVTTGSPYVGDETFRDAHRLLEGLGKLRYLRICNHRDVVCIVPQVAFKWNFWDSSAHSGTRFKHVGMNLRLYKDETPFSISYPRVRTGYYTSSADEMTRALDNSFFSNLSWNPVGYLRNCHSSDEYTRRIRANKVILESMTLNNLYSRKDIVGQLVAEF